MSEPDPFPGIEQFVFSAPLYAKYTFVSLVDVERLYGRGRPSAKIDGHRPFCHRTSTFRVRGASIPSGDPWNNIRERVAFDDFSVECARNEAHRLNFWFLISKLVIEKIGQHPSLADIANDESGMYRSVLTKRDAAEFHRAIGLAAHGVGIGSFVYLRRIFERLIRGRYEEFAEGEGWSGNEFEQMRMDDKVAFLRDHLPPFLVEHRRIYAILSAGVHELEEEQCLAFFDVLKQSIIIMLEEDKKKKEELAMRKKFSDAIKAFDTNDSRQDQDSTTDETDAPTSHDD